MSILDDVVKDIGSGEYTKPFRVEQIPGEANSFRVLWHKEPEDCALKLIENKD